MEKIDYYSVLARIQKLFYFGESPARIEKIDYYSVLARIQKLFYFGESLARIKKIDNYSLFGSDLEIKLNNILNNIYIVAL